MNNIQYSTIPNNTYEEQRIAQSVHASISEMNVIKFEEKLLEYSDYQTTWADSMDTALTLAVKSNILLIERIVQLGGKSLFLQAPTMCNYNPDFPSGNFIEVGGKVHNLESAIAFTPLHHACAAKNSDMGYQIAKKLIYLGSPINIISDKSFELAKLTPLDVVLNYGTKENYLKLAILLLRNGGIALQNTELEAKPTKSKNYLKQAALSLKNKKKPESLKRLKIAKKNLMTDSEKILAIHFNQHNPNQVPKDIITYVLWLSLKLDLQD